MRRVNFVREKLDQLALDIEFLLISVVQGVALGVLAGSASAVVENLRFEYWIYIVLAFLIILVFWSGAIIHAISFIDWPLDLNHNFLYFLASLIEVMAFSQMAHPLRWFIFLLIFFVVAAVLYFVDLKLIEARKSKFDGNESYRRLYSHLLERQRFELKYLVPAGIIYNLAAIVLIYRYPAIFLVNNFHILLALVQVLFIAGVLFNSIRSFKMRTKLISNCLNSRA